jgi:hypothetical protein
MNKYKRLKNYISLLLKEETDNENLLSSEEGKKIITQKMKEFSQKISDINKTIADNEIEDFIEEATLLRMGIKNFKNYYLIKFMEINRDYGEEAALDSLSSHMKAQIKTEEIEGSWDVSYLKDNIESVMSEMDEYFQEIKRVIDQIIKKASEDNQNLGDFSEAPPDAPLGKIAFPGLRSDVPFEKNTKVESGLQKAISLHIIKNKMLNAEQGRIIKGLIANNWYTSAFSEPSVQVVYRGMTVPKKYIKGILGRDNVSASGEEDVTWDFKPLAETSSWATSKDAAKRFSHPDGNYGLIMTANVSDNPDKFIDLNGLYSFDAYKLYVNEKEVIALGNITISKIEWF